MAEAAQEGVPAAVRPEGRRCLSARTDDYARGRYRLIRGDDTKPALFLSYFRYMEGRLYLSAERLRAEAERVQHGGSLAGNGIHPSRFVGKGPNSEALEKAPRFLRRKTPVDFTEQGNPAVIAILPDRVMREVAPPVSRGKQLFADLIEPLQDHHRSGGIRHFSADSGHKPSRATAYDCNIIHLCAPVPLPASRFV